MTKTIFFDWYETLSFSKMWGQLEIENPPLFDKIQYHIFKKNPQLTLEWMRGQTTFLNIIYLLLDHGIPREITQIEFIRGMAATQFASPFFISALTSLKEKGYKIAIATDHFDIFGSYMYPYLKLDELFDGYICSAEEGYLKQDEDKTGKHPFFLNYFRKHHLTYKDCILIDNSKKITDIYKNLGMETYHTPETKDVVSVIDHLKNRTL